uniref:F-box domain-containing protein n=1 Tax=Ananas comosus var. bracteatus TaxID=296719 RepID=A0A6V7QYD2_ANACO
MAMAATIEDLHEDVLALVLRRLDGPSLAAASCASARLRGLSGDPAIWRDLCLATWPSLRLLPLPSPSPRPSPSSPTRSPSPGAARRRRRRGSRRPGGSLPAPPRPHLRRRPLPPGRPGLLARPRDPRRLPLVPRLPLPHRRARPQARGALGGGDLDLARGADPELDRDRPGSRARGEPVEPEAGPRGPALVHGETLVRFATVVREFSVTAAVTCGEGEDPVREVSLVVEDADGIG